MAFNPFSAFRKHKKVTFAALTIVCMFVFVLQAGFSGGGDALDQIARWLGTRGFQGSDIAQLNGKQLSPAELRAVRQQRELANTYMRMACAQIIEALRDSSRLDQPDFAKTHAENLRRMQILGSYLEVPPLQFRGNTTFFGPMGDRPYSAQELLDHLIWKEQARKLGIHLSDRAVNEETNRLLLDLLTPSMSKGIEDALRKDPRFSGMASGDYLISAMRDELEVRLAKLTLLGTLPGTRLPEDWLLMSRMAQFISPSSFKVSPVAVTPNQFWDFFVDHRTEIDVALLPVRVEDYLAQVTGAPTEAEIKKLYERYKEREHDPEARLPGFKQPRRIQVQWVAGAPDSPYYQQQAQNLKALQQGLFNAAASASPLAGAWPQTLTLALSEGVDLPLAAKYYELWLNDLAGERRLRLPGWSDSIRNPLRDQAVFQPDHVAAALGAAAGGPAVSPWPVLQAMGQAEERRYRAELAAELILAPSRIAAAALVVREMPKETVVPLAAVEGWVRARYRDQLARDVLVQNLGAIRKQIEEYQKEKKLDQLDQYLAGQAEKLHLQTGKSGLHDLHKDPLADDPQLRPLRSAYLRDTPDTTGRFFGHVLFTEARPYQVETWPRSSRESIFPDRDPWRNAPQLFEFWKVDDQPAKVLPLSNATVREEVEQAWRWLKARELAKQAAEAIAQEAGGLQGDLPKLRDFALKNKEELIEGLPKLAKRIKLEEPRPEFPLRYRLSNLPEAKVPSIGRRFLDKVLELKGQPLGSAVAIANQPESIFYVAIVTRKEPPSEEEFFRAYKEASGHGERRGSLYQEFMIDKQQKFYEDFMARLRKDAKLELNDEMVRAFDGDRSGDDF